MEGQREKQRLIRVIGRQAECIKLFCGLQSPEDQGK